MTLQVPIVKLWPEKEKAELAVTTIATEGMKVVDEKGRLQVAKWGMVTAILPSLFRSLAVIAVAAFGSDVIKQRMEQAGPQPPAIAAATEAPANVPSQSKPKALSEAKPAKAEKPKL